MNNATNIKFFSNGLEYVASVKRAANGPTSDHRYKVVVSDVGGAVVGDGWFDRRYDLHNYSASLSGFGSAIRNVVSRNLSF